jgi:hypothetical protein
MAKVTVLKALTNFFNTGEGKRPAKVWMEEIKALTLAQKVELATLVVAETGDTL